MSVKRWLSISFFIFILFVGTGYIIAFHSAAVSKSPIGTNFVLTVTAVSLFSWPFCLVRAFQVYMKDRSKR
jgi:hypothetical protein